MLATYLSSQKPVCQVLVGGRVTSACMCKCNHLIGVNRAEFLPLEKMRWDAVIESNVGIICLSLVVFTIKLFGVLVVSNPLW